MNLDGYALVGRVWGHVAAQFERGEIDREELMLRAADFEKIDRWAKKLSAQIMSERQS